MPDDDSKQSAAHAATVAGHTSAASHAATVAGDASAASHAATVAGDTSAASHAATVAGDASAVSHAATVAGDHTIAASRVSATAMRSTPNFVRGRELARGGMGRVVIAEDRRLDRTVALKLLQHQSPAFRARFEREATITARLAHPAIVPVYEAGTFEDGEPFYAMKLVEGKPLDETIAKAKDLPARLGLLSSAMAVCEALAYAHSRRIIHRDLKPANVLVGKFGETVVIDWGLAKDLDAPAAEPSLAGIRGSPTDSGMTLDGEVVGTPSYMPPEQATGSGVDERADVYALGALLYHVVAGRPPYRGRTAHEILDAVEAGPPPPLVTVEPGVPDDLASIIAKAMARKPAERYPTAGELAEELRRFIDGRLVSSHRYTGAELFRRWLRRHRTAVVVGAIALGVLAVGAIVSVRKIVAREHETAHALAQSRLEQGRQLLVDGDPAQAAPFITAALAELGDDPVALRLAATTVRDAERHVASLEGRTAAFRRDGRELAIGRGDGAIQVIDPATGAVLRTLKPGGGAIIQLDYAPDGGWIAVAAATGAYLCDAGTGARIAIAGDASPTEVRFVSRDRIAIASATGVMLVGRDGTLVASDRAAPDARVLTVAGEILVGLSHHAAIAWRISDLGRVAEAPSGGATRYAATFDHGELVTTGTDGMRRWSAPDHAVTIANEELVTLARVDDHTLLAGGTIVDRGVPRVFAHAPIEAAAIVDATHVITGGYDRTLRVWDLTRTARPSIVLDVSTAPELLVADPTGQRVVSRGGRADARIELWDISHLPGPTRTTVVGTRIDWIAADHHDRLAVAAHDHDVQLTKLLTTTFEMVALVDGWPIGFRPDHDELVTDLDGKIAIYSARTGAHIRDLVDPTKIWHVAFSGTGAVIATSSDRHVTLRGTDWQVAASFDTPPGISAIAIDDHDHLVTGHDDGTLRIWNAHTGTLLATATGHTSHIESIEIHGDLLVTGSWDLTTRLWAFPSGASRGLFKAFDHVVDAISFSPDRALLATADGSTEVKLWDAAQGRLIDRLATTDELACVTFLDDAHVVAGGNGGHLELFDLSAPVRSVDELVRLATTFSKWHLDHGRAVER